MLQKLRLETWSENWDKNLVKAREKNYSHERLLKIMLEQEVQFKKEKNLERRIKHATFEEVLRIETYPFRQQPNFKNKKKLLGIYDSFEYVEKKQNITWIGPTGCGKSGFATGFMLQAIDRGLSVKAIRFNKLISDLHNALADRSENKLLKRFAKYDILCVDEIGYVRVEPDQAGLFFSLIQMRHKKKTNFFTSNLGFSEWGKYFQNDQLTDALVDRITENSHIFNMKNCISLRRK